MTRSATGPGTGRVAGVVLALATALLAGCGGDPREAYCELVAERQEDVTRAAGEAGQEGLLAALPILSELAEAAPRDVADEWDRVVDSLTGLRDSLSEAGVDPATYDPEQPPADLDRSARARIRAAADQVGSQRTVAAVNAVEQHARDVCGTPLAL